ncbi:MAG: CPBP family intramembrane metalloprotease [Planctomycetes bacterium]|nr:CPBP family intramembrane metalloprotease [Planctomycetota bacterium]
MGGALLGGWLDRGVDREAVAVVEPTAPDRVSARFGVAVVSAPDALDGEFAPDVVVFAVKPQGMAEIVPAYRRFAGAGTVFLSIAAGIIAIIIIVVFMNRFYRKSTREVALVRTGFGGQKVVLSSGCLSLPFLHRVEEINMRTIRVEIQRTGNKSLITTDRIRVDMDLDFYIRVQPTKEGVGTAAQAIGEQGYDVVIYFPRDFNVRLQEFRDQLKQRDGQAPSSDAIPSPQLFFDNSKDKSKLAHRRISQVLRRWTDEIGVQNLVQSDLPPTVTHPFSFSDTDLAAPSYRDTSLWSKVLPFVLLIWALTGAFYPAIDLCAGEKERGTLETLLSSPAERSEIVMGKLFTIMAFSIATAVLNLAGMALTGKFLMSQFSGIGGMVDIGPPPMSALVWLPLALVPMSALFSALCLALAAFARSTKEGQYYLMPLMLITLPLTILPMTPTFELNLGNSLIPVSGMMLLMRETIQGNYREAAPFVVPVLAVTLMCCWFAVRWAIDQFNRESVLFRQGERVDVSNWIRHKLRDRGPTPTALEALLCGVILLVIRFYAMSSMKQQDSFTGFAVSTTVMQIALIATPAMLMAVMLTSSPRRTLLLTKPALLTLPAAVLLAVALHPGVLALSEVVSNVFPMSDGQMEQINELLAKVQGDAPNVWMFLLVIAVLPAICEEIAFRGFILSGLRHLGHKWQAIVISSIFFGVAHMMVQQSLMAALVGVVIGYIAVQSGNLLPCIMFHMTHNALAVVAGNLREDSRFEWLYSGDAYRWWVVALGAGIAAALLLWFRALPYSKTEEELWQEAVDKSAQATPG